MILHLRRKPSYDQHLTQPNETMHLRDTARPKEPFFVDTDSKRPPLKAEDRVVVIDPNRYPDPSWLTTYRVLGGNPHVPGQSYVTAVAQGYDDQELC